MAQQEETISIIVAIGHDAQGRSVIGNKGKLLWQLPEDMARFKSLTMGHPVIMGRKTWESIPEKYRPLVGRTNIVVTRDSAYEATGAITAQSFPQAISLAREAQGSGEIFAIGGTQIYECALPFAHRLYLTVVNDEKEGDTFFPPYEADFTNVVQEEAGAHGDISYRFLTLERA